MLMHFTALEETPATQPTEVEHLQCLAVQAL